MAVSIVTHYNVNDVPVVCTAVNVQEIYKKKLFYFLVNKTISVQV